MQISYDCRRTFLFVIAGLDPAIHNEAQQTLTVSMDARVEPGHDKVWGEIRDDDRCSHRFATSLAFPFRTADIKSGRLAVDEPLANRVRSGRKQP
jgi:hypothetical protein